MLIPDRLSAAETRRRYMAPADTLDIRERATLAFCHRPGTIGVCKSQPAS